jgi:hypothetical protein
MHCCGEGPKRVGFVWRSFFKTATVSALILSFLHEQWTLPRSLYLANATAWKLRDRVILVGTARLNGSLRPYYIHGLFRIKNP